MKVLDRAFTVLTDAPYLLNLECNHYTNNSKALKEIVLYNGLEKGIWSSSFGSSPHTKVKHRLYLPLILCSHMGIVILNLGCCCFIAHGVAKLFYSKFVTATSGVRI